jgi:cyclophilin family peptidyl-prolyl cis-trans isomerase
MRNTIINILLALALIATFPVMANNPKVLIETSVGNITLELDAEKAPKTVENFLAYADEGFYQGTVFHRVIDGFMIQGGGFTADYERKTTNPPVINEADNGLKNRRGTIAMARTPDPHSATAQFFINVKDNDNLDYTSKSPRGWGYAVFGQVVKGMDTVDRIRQVKTGPGGVFPQNAPLKMVIINRISVVPPKPAKK